MVLQSEERERERERDTHAGYELKLQMAVLSFRLRGVSSSFGIYLLKESFNNIKMDNI